MTSGIEAKSRFGKQDFVHLSDEDVYRCPAGETLRYYYTNEENGLKLRRYWTNVPPLHPDASLYDRPATPHHALGA
jgi:hypothetical protein